MTLHRYDSWKAENAYDTRPLLTPTPRMRLCSLTAGQLLQFAARPNRGRQARANPQAGVVPPRRLHWLKAVSARSEASGQSCARRCLLNWAGAGRGCLFWADARVRTAEPVSVDEHSLNHALDVVAGFGERDAFHPIDRVHNGRARIAIGLNPLGNVAPTCVIRGKHENWKPLPILHQLAEVRGTELRVVGRIKQAPEVEFEPEPFSRPSCCVRHQLHKPERTSA